ncbi:glutaredoxin 3 [Pseudoteredinibacter isoporae]|uniref:Glutaredoxin n=1 Tax=Pseudoteredinibacter isoporae TaxID=570281 RepID=A0A7X0JPE7_9GAMM|nr:glutaredoxin 3 [Pseudoteredinibacter isoporae]MBB6519864.1 glutaredoxin 3 [Pseudoteredinibacter isoporae]NHO85442.1 glutaredoxin 3 [Pseudoteredinibacter isoporae]NIB26106.1 glutaredoxin 3 [Pseudoteredinibacter isoporae]
MADVTIYSSDFCPFCHRAKALLSSKGVDFKELNVDGNPELRAEMMHKAQQRTVPQIWIGQSHVGGCDDLYALERTGQLDPMLARAG